MPPSSPKIVKSLSGKHFVAYQCPNCGEGLRNPIEQAGSSDSCPKCQKVFIVPGVELAKNVKRQADADLVAKQQKRKEKEYVKEQKQLERRNKELEQRFAAARQNDSTSERGNSDAIFSNRDKTGDALAWAVEFTRFYLGTILYFGLALCIIAVAGFTIWFVISITSLERLEEVGPLLAIYIGQLFVSLIFAISLIVSVGTVAVFFEIEKSARSLRAYSNINPSAQSDT